MTNEDQQYYLQHLLKEFPADEFHWTKAKTLTLQEALFLSYGIEPPNKTSPGLLLYFDRFIKEVDVYHIHDLLQRAVESRDLLMYNWQYIMSSDFVNWANKIGIPIKKEFFFSSVEIEEEESGVIPNVKRPKIESLRKEIFRLAAQLHWRKEEKELQNHQSKLKDYTRPTDLARSKEMKELARIVNHIGQLNPIRGEEFSDSGVDPEWFSHLFPGETKSGPKRNTRNKDKK